MVVRAPMSLWSTLRVQAVCLYETADDIVHSSLYASPGGLAHGGDIRPQRMEADFCGVEQLLHHVLQRGGVGRPLH